MNPISFDTFYLLFCLTVRQILSHITYPYLDMLYSHQKKIFKKNLFFTNYWINSNQFIKLQINYAFPMLDSVHKKRKKPYLLKKMLYISIIIPPPIRLGSRPWCWSKYCHHTLVENWDKLKSIRKLDTLPNLTLAYYILGVK